MFSSSKNIKYSQAVKWFDTSTSYYWDGATPNKVEAFEQDKDFMLNFEQFGANIRDRPKIGKSLGLVDYDFHKIDIHTLKNLMQEL